MRLIDGMKDEKLGSALLYNFTKGYGKVPMKVYNVVLPLLFDDTFCMALSNQLPLEECIASCFQKDENYKTIVYEAMERQEAVTSSALGIALLNKDLDFIIQDGEMCGQCKPSSIVSLPEAILLGSYLQGKDLDDILNLFSYKDKKIVFLDSNTIGKDIDFSPLDRLGKVSIYDQIADEEIASVIQDANVIITNKKILGKEQLLNAKKVELICVTATGINNIDIEYCKEHNIVVSNVKGYSTDSVAQHTLALLLDIYHKNNYYHTYIQSGNYSSSSLFTHLQYPFYELTGKTWGIVGMGDIGKKVASLAVAFGCNVQYYSTSRKNNQQPYQQVDFSTLLETSDIISIHAPLTKESENLFDKKAFGKMKSTAYIINVARGKIINEYDLAEALNKREIAGAGLDVFDQEPFYVESPLLQIEDPTRLIMTPHIAWAAVEARRRLMNEVALNIQAYISGEERNVVTK